MPATKTDWWKAQNIKYNRGIRAAFVCFVTTVTLLIAFTYSSLTAGIYAFFISGFSYLVYIAVFYFILLLSEFTDRRYDITINPQLKNFLFRVFFWLSLGLPFYYPCFIAYFLITH